MKHLKKKLMAATAMMLLSAIMLTGTSYAWFTLSTNPEITGISGTVASNKNLEIALDEDGNEPGDSEAGDTEDYTTWGNLVEVTLDDVNLKPVKFEAGAITSPTFGEDGRMEAFGTAQTAGDGITYFVDESGNNIAASVAFWMRSNQAGTVELVSAQDRGAGAESTEGTAGTLPDGVHVAFYVDGEEKSNFTSADFAAGASTGVKLSAWTAHENSTAVKVIMYIYRDGSEVYNSNINTDGTFDLNVQFGLGDMTGNDAMDY